MSDITELFDNVLNPTVKEWQKRKRQLTIDDVADDMDALGAKLRAQLTQEQLELVGKFNKGRGDIHSLVRKEYRNCRITEEAKVILIRKVWAEDRMIRSGEMEMYTGTPEEWLAESLLNI